MEQFNPAKAIETLKQNYVELMAVGELIESKSNQHTLAEAELIDAENVAREEYFTRKPCKISELRDWLRMKTAFEYARETKLKNELRSLKQKLEILIEVNNNVKASYRIFEMDYKMSNQQD